MDTNEFDRLLKEERERLGPRAATRLVEGPLLFKATLISDGANVDHPVGRPVWAYSAAQAVAWAGRQRGIYLSLGRFAPVEASVWHGQCRARIVTCLSRFDPTRPSPTGYAAPKPQLTFADARTSGFMARQAALPDPAPEAPSFNLRPPPVSRARRPSTRQARSASRADNSSLPLFATPNTT